MQTKIKKICFKEQNIYIGIDVHFKNWVITIMVEDIVYKIFSQNPNAKDLKKHLEYNIEGYEVTPEQIKHLILSEFLH